MLRNFKDFEHHKVSATDGEIGEVKDFYFDDDSWVVRYLVVDAGSWLQSRKVLISPVSIMRPDWLARTLRVSISRDQVKQSPDIDTHQPVSRQNEEQVLGFYGYPPYWQGSGMWGDDLYPYALSPAYAGPRVSRAERERQLEAYLRDERTRHRNDDPHLRSSREVSGYDIHATDGDIGHVSGFLLDDDTWAIRYLIVDTSNWWMGHKVLVAPPWIQAVNWAERSVTVDLSREAIRNAPPYDLKADWRREDELGLYAHHGRRGYWADPAEPEVGA